MACEREYTSMIWSLIRYGINDERYLDAQESYQQCLRTTPAEGGMILYHNRIFRIFEEIPIPPEELEEGKEPVPPRPPSCGIRSVKIRSEIFGKKENGMIFSRKLDEAFAESGVKLEDDETYTCLVCVVKKPKGVSDALALNPLGVNMGDTTSVNFIMEQAIMEPVMNRVEQDKISYASKKAKK